MTGVYERAYAKINLTLDVLGKRPDGYHDLDMVMQTVSLYDEVAITLSNRPGIEVDINRPDLPTGLHNLAGKAAKAFLNYVNLPNLGVKVDIIKNIPDKAGLAGGSADAAAVIRGLCRLLPETKLTTERKLELCAKIGSDVAFCLAGGTKRAAGRGELLSALPAMPDCGVVIVKPGFSVSTPELFDVMDSVRPGKRPSGDAMSNALGRGNLSGVCRELGNVFEEALPAPERQLVDDIKAVFRACGAMGACMSGTGSAVFGIFPANMAVDLRDMRGFGDVFFTKPVGDLV